MSNKIQVIQDKAGNNVFPITHEKAVRDSSGVSLEAKLSALESKTYVEAWDGASTPVVANIPAGVVVSYDGTSYTGTLAASSSTDGKIYLVKDGTEQCSKLQTAPELPALTLTSYCYHQMFRYCSKLNYVKAMFTTTPGSSYTSNWLGSVASTGTFVKNSSATWTTRGSSAVPNNWTIQTASS